MAESKNNVIVHGLSGRFGDLIVFRQNAGKTLAAQPPRSSSAPPTAKQLAVREKFQQAVIYGAKVMADSTLKEEYGRAAEPGQTAFNVAVADFFDAPDIKEIDVSKYTGGVLQPIKVQVKDTFKVKEVNVSIFNPDGEIVDGGPATKDPKKDIWVFMSQVANPDLAGDKIVVEATDYPGNEASKEEVL